jgi:hypothetical protein
LRTPLTRPSDLRHFKCQCSSVTYQRGLFPMNSESFG